MELRVYRCFSAKMAHEERTEDVMRHVEGPSQPHVRMSFPKPSDVSSTGERRLCAAIAVTVFELSRWFAIPLPSSCTRRSWAVHDGMHRERASVDVDVAVLPYTSTAFACASPDIVPSPHDSDDRELANVVAVVALSISLSRVITRRLPMLAIAVPCSAIPIQLHRHLPSLCVHEDKTACERTGHWAVGVLRLVVIISASQSWRFRAGELSASRREGGGACMSFGGEDDTVVVIQRCRPWGRVAEEKLEELDILLTLNFSFISLSLPFSGGSPSHPHSLYNPVCAFYPSESLDTMYWSDDDIDGTSEERGEKDATRQNVDAFNDAS
ncbi:hypothetical protein SCHPADRAFT_896715 [Schizopora paradoxa]|uniref:Uncharacterized protein n=1 Tax=Schizopora paradoxa TaxID=27342 RepID=A0A0H2R5V9_9AGAM|nr:hypothetical protein SCHPADRAFT_896715 [Schizopora paradoxa]